LVSSEGEMKVVQQKSIKIGVDEGVKDLEEAVKELNTLIF
jgi:hypothetical protein